MTGISVTSVIYQIRFLLKCFRSLQFPNQALQQKVTIFFSILVLKKCTKANSLTLLLKVSGVPCKHGFNLILPSCHSNEPPGPGGCMNGTALGKIHTEDFASSFAGRNFALETRASYNCEKGGPF